MEHLAGRHAFVTGAAHGIGHAIAHALADASVFVTLADIDADALAAAAAERPDHFAALLLDTRDRAGWASARASAEAAHGPVSILVNNAGIGPDGSAFADMDPGAFDRVIAINLTGIFNGISTFAAAMRDRGDGHIVNTASMAGLMTDVRLGAYTAAKFAVVGMTEVLRKEMAPHGVGASVLCPGLVATDLRETTRKAGSAVTTGDLSAGLNAIDPAKVGARVVAAIRADALFILTHGEYAGVVERRMARVAAAMAATPPSSAL